MAEEGRRKVQVNFSESVYNALEDLAKRRGKSMAEVLRDAVSLEKWLDERLENGARLLIEEDGKRQELVFRR